MFSRLGMMKIVTIQIPEAWLKGTDVLVKDGIYQNRSAPYERHS